MIKQCIAKIFVLRHLYCRKCFPSFILMTMRSNTIGIKHYFVHIAYYRLEIHRVLRFFKCLHHCSTKNSVHQRMNVLYVSDLFVLQILCQFHDLLWVSISLFKPFKILQQSYDASVSFLIREFSFIDRTGIYYQHGGCLDWCQGLEIDSFGDSIRYLFTKID